MTWNCLIMMWLNCLFWSAFYVAELYVLICMIYFMLIDIMFLNSIVCPGWFILFEVYIDPKICSPALLKLGFANYTDVWILVEIRVWQLYCCAWILMELRVYFVWDVH